MFSQQELRHLALISLVTHTIKYEEYIWGYLPALFRLDFGILWIKTL